MLASNDFLELIDNDGSKLWQGPSFKLGLDFKVNQRFVHKAEGPMREGQPAEDQPHPTFHFGDLDEKVSRLAEDKVGVDGQVEAAAVLDVQLEVQFLGASIFGAGDGPEELDVPEDGHHVAQVDIPKAEPLQDLAGHLGLEQLLKLHLDLPGDPVPHEGRVPELPEEEEADGVEPEEGLLRGLHQGRRLLDAGQGLPGQGVGRVGL